MASSILAKYFKFEYENINSFEALLTSLLLVGSEWMMENAMNMKINTMLDRYSPMIMELDRA